MTEDKKTEENHEIHKVDSDANIKDRIKVVLDKFEARLVGTPDSQPEIPQELSKIRTVSVYYASSHYAEEKGRTQAEFLWREPDYPAIHGFLDMLNKTWAYEFKYTSNPEWYMSKFGISDQLSCYFLGIPDLQRITLRAIQVPTLRTKKDETPEQYQQRIVEDMERQPQHYIVDRNYFRTEFVQDMVEVKEKARFMVREIANAIESLSGGGFFSFWQNKASCFRPRPCQYLPLCEASQGDLLNDAILNTMYQSRSKPDGAKQARVQSNVHDMRSERNWEDDVSI